MADVDHELGAIRFIVVSWLNSLSIIVCLMWKYIYTHTMAEIYILRCVCPRERITKQQFRESYTIY